MNEIILLLWFLVIVLCRGLTHSWHWATRKTGGLYINAHPFIKNFAEPHLAITVMSYTSYAAMLYLGVHWLSLIGIILIAWPLFDGLIDIGRGKSFFSENTSFRWCLQILGKKVMCIPRLAIPNEIEIALGVVALILRFLYF